MICSDEKLDLPKSCAKNITTAKQSTIAERLLKHFANGGEVSIYNMKAVWISNPAREVVRCFESIHGITLKRDRQPKPTGGYYINYSVHTEDLPKVKQIKS